MGVPKITSLYCLYNNNSGIFWETHDRCVLDQRGKGLMGKQPNFPIGILRKFLIFLLYYHLLFPKRILKGCLVY